MHRCLFALVMATALPQGATAHVVGTMAPAEPLSAARIATLPTAQQPAWQAYLALSQRLHAQDEATLAAERTGLANIPAPPANGPSGGGGLRLNHPPSWFAGQEARAIADNIVSFQTPAGGWGKNQDRRSPPRKPGQVWVVAETKGPEAAIAYIGTFDNDATIDELRFLATVQAQLPGTEGDGYRTSLLKGLGYALAAQMPNGGFPQVFPLQGGYHDAITINDDALARIGGLLRAVGAGKGGFAFVPADMRAKASAAHDRVVAVLLACQLRVGGQPALWGQQHDALSLAPVGARNFEPASLATGESVGVLTFLMEEDQPSPAIQRAIAGGAAFLAATAMPGLVWTRDEHGDKVLMASNKPGTKPLWPRYIALDGKTALFGDRDRSIHDDVREISLERRNGYAWYGTWGERALDAYAAWRRKWGAR
jgi:PelA/Pel-15E family pectate lyase